LKKQKKITVPAGYQRIVHPAGLGLCEHCGELLTLENMPSEAMDAEWRCPNCNNAINHKTFGFEEVNGEWEKIRWVGKDGKWTSERPKENFDLGAWHVSDKPIMF